MDEPIHTYEKYIFMYIPSIEGSYLGKCACSNYLKYEKKQHLMFLCRSFAKNRYPISKKVKSHPHHKVNHGWWTMTSCEYFMIGGNQGLHMVP